MEFESAKSFAHFIKVQLHEYAAEPDDMKERLRSLQERYGDQSVATGYTFYNQFTPLNTAYQEVMSSIAKEFYQTLPEPVRQQFQQHFYFTTIDNRKINASIIRSPDGRFYGVFVFSLLITALHRLGKLELSALFPEEVFCCSRFPGESATREKMTKIYHEVLAHFIETKLPLGPQLLLREPMNSHHMLKLDLQEKLIIYHEIAHFLNGDLKQGSEDRKLIDIFPNLSYQQEHLADIIAYGLLLRQLKLKGQDSREFRYLLLMCLINLYQIQHQIQGLETETYPHPLNRMGVVITKFYGCASEEWVGEAILNHQMQNLVFDNFPIIDSEEEVILNYIDQKLGLAFDE